MSNNNLFVNAINGLKKTENGAVAYKTTNSAVYDLFALGAAYRGRSGKDCIELFDEAFNENPLLAMKCLFYIRDIRGGQGERRFTRVILNHLAKTNPKTIINNIELIPEFGRWDDLYSLVETPCWSEAAALMGKQLLLDLNSKTPSLLAKWLKSENASSTETKKLATVTRQSLDFSPRSYRKILSSLREKINIVERLMSENRWDEIEFDKIPSKAGIIYKNAFARRDIIKAKYEAFAKDDSKTVNAKALYPYEVVRKALAAWNETEIAIVDKYWTNMPDYTGENDANVLVMADVSGSMYSGEGSVRPIDVSIALALYFADKQKGAFKNQYMTFETMPRFCTVEGKNIAEKARNANDAPWGGSTNLSGAFEEILRVAKENNVPQKDMPDTLIVVSDMEIDEATDDPYNNNNNQETEMANVRKKFAEEGYKVPHIIYWNVDARNDTILDRADGTTCVSGCSPVIFESALSGKTGYDLMMEKLNSERYAKVVA